MTPLRARPFDRHAVTRRHAGLDFSLLLPLGWTLETPAQEAPPAAEAWVELARARSPGGAAGEAARVVVSGCQRSEALSLEDAAWPPHLPGCGRCAWGGMKACRPRCRAATAAAR
jgi:hypothetical protein